MPLGMVGSLHKALRVLKHRFLAHQTYGLVFCFKTDQFFQEDIDKGFGVLSLFRRGLIHGESHTAQFTKNPETNVIHDFGAHVPNCLRGMFARQDR